ncbi:GNAT family N-acetyltransferase [Paenibacillus methanolicus]|uniref:Ribosomal protein S18 acetylase RimI-like enzyme n=1 Tax=Paenibacillus methanolicus TaxID=582686 RepID=A0A5S5C0K6_9BACL|nr:GNAT family N-acetyltransferase [Paenibacillus methanolicus]TYP71986.1 ribosomal protein S18 acetylase RimI-like enzyme [Paenibacillus methanolicus]
MVVAVEVRQMVASDVELVYRVFHESGIGKPMAYIRECWEQNEAGDRITLLAFYQGAFAGSLHLLHRSHYPYFAQNGIPEINDFNVIPALRKHGIGTALMDEAEKIALGQHSIVGIGVGLYRDYGSAQRMYAKRGYVPDGRGVMVHNQPVVPGSSVCVDDDLVLYFTKVKA